uniref:Transmembrane protein n=1 Tax=Toxocara canis TaxID=6265 RepID=A0A183UHP9_TOXCA
LAFVKRSLGRFIAAEVIVFGGLFLGFCHLRRSEKTREFLYRYTPAVANLYYWVCSPTFFTHYIYYPSGNCWASCIFSFHSLEIHYFSGVSDQGKVEDSASFGQLTGTRRKRSDLNRWFNNNDGCFASYVVFEQWRQWRPSPEMPVQSWEKYIRIQKEAKKNV